MEVQDLLGTLSHTNMDGYPGFGSYFIPYSLICMDIQDLLGILSHTYMDGDPGFVRYFIPY